MNKGEVSDISTIRRIIQSEFPDVRIRVLDNPKDWTGGVLYVQNAPKEFESRFSFNPDFNFVQIGTRKKNEFIVSPINSECI